MSEHDKFAPLADFNWDAIGKKSQNYSADERSKMETMYENTLQSVTEHDVIDGTIVAITSKDLLVNIGYKSDGIVPLSEVRYNPEIKVGDKLEVYVESQEDKSGQLILSHKKARALRSWDRVNEASEKEEIIKGFASRSRAELCRLFK
jgi:small subunit ribosomal protein S1